ncbi:uncharacterized protein si:ch211-168f7.5 [Boleophthalmus pectinirostris]|uniref:uncharacterized protein si:ch211-168f7.5 n=1 Tax=Boleophthalmus pectinirostris TaxID=150288 RepID=UPI00242E3653|nr:uncharacterized protein si:ch211-168f7.5 [Boleophthalmus pectinirostris]
MAGRRGCVNSLWSGTERVRIGERLKATLAGVLELELLRCKQLELVDAALDSSRNQDQSCITSLRQQFVSPPDITALPAQSSPGESADGTVHTAAGCGGHTRWSTLSWDTSSDLLSPPTPDPISMAHLDSDSRPSSGFYSVSGSSLSDSCYSVSSEVAHGQVPARPQKLWDQCPPPDSADILWTDVQTVQHTEAECSLELAEVTNDLEASGLSFLSDLCSGCSNSIIPSLLHLLCPSSSSALIDLKSQLDPRYCADLVSRRTKEVYPYPSPLHAVALQSPLFTTQESTQATPSPEAPQSDDCSQPTSNNDHTLLTQPATPTQISFTQLEQYINRLARQYHARVSASTTDLTSFGSISLRGVCTGKGHGSTQSLSAFESLSTPCALGGNITPCKSQLGNSARVSLITTGKKATRNSINLGNLPSATGEDLSINLHLNVNLNLNPGLNSSRSLVDTPKRGSCGALKSEFTTASSSSLTSTPTPALRPRPRISTCPSSLSHRSSLEIAPSFGSSNFCRSLDFSGSAPEHMSVHGSNSGSAPVSQRNSFNQESSPNFPMVEEISRLSGLSKDIVVGLMEQGVELDIDCFDGETPGDMRGHGKGHLDQSHEYTREMGAQRPIQLSLSVTHSPQSQSSLTPPLSHTSSPIHPYQSNYMPVPHHPHYYPHDLPSSTASSPASRPTPRARSPPHPLQPSPMGATPLSVFRRDAPFQCSLPRTNTRSSAVDQCGIPLRGGSLRQSGGGGWKRSETQGLYRGKHASHKLIRAATVSSYAKREDYGSVWAEDKVVERGVPMPKKNSTKLWSRFEGRLFGKDPESEQEEIDRAEYGFGWRRNTSGSYRREQDKDLFWMNEPKGEYSPMFSKRRGREDGERRSSSLRISRRALFRSESQGLLVSRHHEEPVKRALWVSSLDVGQGSMRKDEGVRLLRKREDKGLSSTASLFNLSHSESIEGSCQSMSPLSSPSFSPSPPRRTLQRSRSLRDLGKKVFGSMRSLSLKRKPSKK